MRKMIAVFAFALLCVPLAAIAGYEAVEATYRPVETGYEVSFVVHNQFSRINWDIFGLLVYARYDQAATSASGPAGWRIYNDPRCGIEWEALSSDYYITHGDSLGGFTYTTAVPPGTLDYVLHVKEIYSWGGGKVTPALVPEPSSLAALGGGMMGLLALRRRRR